MSLSGFFSQPSRAQLMDSFVMSTPQKHLFRELKLSDTAVKNPGILRWNGLSRQYAATATTSSVAGKKRDDDDDDEEDETPAPTTGGGGVTAMAMAMASVKGAPRIPTKEQLDIVVIHIWADLRR
ncbi:hypothetical protein BJ165DRAFT_670558 [Panaeolus papilionaceus]|nr:hypothetical protein BJ165DRAFT_670558 [Panaeolus papilionaceus]